MKLADWARKQGIAYLTAYRWFRDGKLPVKAYQSDSGTIIVEDDDDKLEQPMLNNLANQDSNIFGVVLKKVVEYSKNNSTIEDFAAYILSNFSLKPNSGTDSPRYSKNKPKPEDIQKHFQQFIPKGERPKPNMFVTDDLDDLVEEDEFKTAEDAKSINSFDSRSLSTSFCSVSGTTGSDGMAYSNLITPQNYTVSTRPAFRRLSRSNLDDTRSLSDIKGLVEEISDCDLNEATTTGPTGAFKPTQKELELAKKAFKPAPRRRGRKPSKNSGKNNEPNK